MTVFFLISLALAIGCIAVYYWIITIIDIIRSDFENEGTKYLWLVAVLVFPFVGTIVYRYVSHHYKRIDTTEYGFVD